MSLSVHAEGDRRALLEALEATSVDELFEPIPPALRLARLALPPGMSEAETRTTVEKPALQNRPPDAACFLGAGCYRHFIPAAVRALVSRGEFATAYTPYQPEAFPVTVAPTCRPPESPRDPWRRSFPGYASATARPVSPSFPSHRWCGTTPGSRS